MKTSVHKSCKMRNNLKVRQSTNVRLSTTITQIKEYLLVNFLNANFEVKNVLTNFVWRLQINGTALTLQRENGTCAA